LPHNQGVAGSACPKMTAAGPSLLSQGTHAAAATQAAWRFYINPRVSLSADHSPPALSTGPPKFPSGQIVITRTALDPLVP